jgi:hypothetical protein
MDADPHAKRHGVTTGQLDRQQSAHKAARIWDKHHDGNVRVLVVLPRAFSVVLLRSAKNWVGEAKANMPVVTRHRPPAKRGR